MRIAAFLAIIAGLMPKFGAVIATIPTGVVGGISIILFGMIASVGARTLVDKHVDLSSSRNLIISSAILVLGLGGATLSVKVGVINFALEGMALAAIVGILLNKILPEEKKYE
jgi:uracil permease